MFVQRLACRIIFWSLTGSLAMLVNFGSHADDAAFDPTA